MDEFDLTFWISVFAPDGYVLPPGLHRYYPNSRRKCLSVTVADSTKERELIGIIDDVNGERARGSGQMGHE